MQAQAVLSREEVITTKLPSRLDARPPVPWRHTVEGADHVTTLHAAEAGEMTRSLGTSDN